MEEYMGPVVGERYDGRQGQERVRGGKWEQEE